MISDFQKQDHASGGRAPAHTTPEVGYYLWVKTRKLGILFIGILWKTYQFFA